MTAYPILREEKKKRKKYKQTKQNEKNPGYKRTIIVCNAKISQHSN